MYWTENTVLPCGQITVILDFRMMRLYFHQRQRMRHRRTGMDYLDMYGYEQNAKYSFLQFGSIQKKIR